jgi:hypothetical protein
MSALPAKSHGGTFSRNPNATAGKANRELDQSTGTPATAHA